MSATDGPGRFGVLLQQHRATAGLSQEELAERAGLSRRGISDLERGQRRRPHAATVRRLADALGLDSPGQAALVAAAREHAVPSGPPASPGNLRLPLTSFVGREREVVELQDLLRTTRLLTLTGAGGIGKTRLALRLAAEVAQTYPDGAWLVELAGVADPSLVPETVADGLGVRGRPGCTLTGVLVAALESRHLLLVLDNCEHLVQACAELAEALLWGCPRLRVLATSRELLGATGETAWPVPPLSLPGRLDGRELDAMGRSEAVRLFVARAQAARPDFALGEETARSVAEVCRRLDGIPLALELAAARVRLLSVDQIAARLDDRFRLLVGSGRTGPLRQHTLRATVDWSYELLSEPERRLFHRLAVFAGGWTLEALEAVCAEDGLERTDLLDLLGRLVDRSLVVVEGTAAGPLRYRMLEMLRQYAQERLAASGSASATAQRHAEYYVTLAERAEPELTGPQQGVWLEVLEREHDNLRAALRWTSEHGQADVSLRLAGALWKFWWVHGHLDEGRWWLEALLASADAVGTAPATLGKALSGAGVLAAEQGDHGRAAALLGQGLALSQNVGDRRGIAWSLNDLAVTYRDQADYARATELLQESLALFRDLGDQRGIAWSLYDLGVTATDQSGNDTGSALLHESLGLFRDVGDRRGSAWALTSLAVIARDVQGDYGQAAALLQGSLALFHELGNQRSVALNMEELAVLACAQDQPEAAVRLLGAAQALREAIGAPRALSNVPAYERAIAVARGQLGEETFATAWAAGRVMTPEQAVAHALARLGTGPA